MVKLRAGHREESVIFSMQTFVVKAASGLAVFITGVSLDMIGLTSKDGLGEGIPTFWFAITRIAFY